jgi:hypothetical protein
MPSIADEVLDTGLATFVAECDTLYVCSQEPTTWAEASSTFALGVKTGAIFSGPSNGNPNGRRVDLITFIDGQINTDGIATHWAACDSGVKQYLGATGVLVAPTSVVSGTAFAMTTPFDITINAASETPLMTALNFEIVRLDLGQPNFAARQLVYPDGGDDAPIATPPYAGFLSRYHGPYRAPWRVAGIDYGVGPNDSYGKSNPWKIPGQDPLPDGVEFGPYNEDTGGGLGDINSNELYIVGDGVLLQGWDFTVNGGWLVAVTMGNDPVIRHCKFSVDYNLKGMLELRGPTFDVRFGQGGTVQACYFDGNRLWPSDNGGGCLTLRQGLILVSYNWFRHAPRAAIQLYGFPSQALEAPVVNRFTIKFNLFDDTACSNPPPGTATAWLQTFPDHQYDLIDIEFNFVKQARAAEDAAPLDGFALDGYRATPPALFDKITVRNNVIFVDPIDNTPLQFVVCYSPTQTVDYIHIDNHFMDLGDGAVWLDDGTEPFTERASVPAPPGPWITPPTGSGNKSLFDGTLPGTWQITSPTNFFQALDLEVSSLAIDMPTMGVA